MPSVTSPWPSQDHNSPNVNLYINSSLQYFFYKELEWQSKISRTVITRFVTTVITSFVTTVITSFVTTVIKSFVTTVITSFVTTVITSFVTTSTPRTDNFETYTLYI